MNSLFFRHLKDLPLSAALRIALRALFILPWLAGAWLASALRIKKWRLRKTGLNFIRKHADRFEPPVISSFHMTPLAGALSNSVAIWHYLTPDAGPQEVFVKVFIPLGGFWMRHLPAVAPFPVIRRRGTVQRFQTDCAVREKLSALGIRVPGLIAADESEAVTATEYLNAENLHEILVRAASGEALAQAAAIFYAAGSLLAKIHEAGYCLIDTQPHNFLWLQNETALVPVDFEFASREEDSAWDNAFFLRFTAWNMPPAASKTIRGEFIRGYANSRPWQEEAVRAWENKLEPYRALFLMIQSLRRTDSKSKRSYEYAQA